jgi:hypothetical protein
MPSADADTRSRTHAFTNVFAPPIIESCRAKEEHHQLPFIAHVPEDRWTAEEEIEGQPGGNEIENGVVCVISTGDWCGAGWKKRG